MKRKQLNTDDDSGDYTPDLPAALLRQKKMPKIKPEEHNSSDSDSDSCVSWSSTTKDLPLRAMKQSVIDWIRQCYTVGSQGWTAKADIFDHYLAEWARMGKEPQLTAPAFGRLVHKAFPGIKSCRMGPRVRARHCYKLLVSRDACSSPAHSPVTDVPSSSLMSTSSSSSTSTSAASTPYSTSPESSPAQALFLEKSEEEMEQVLIDLESELESEMIGLGHPTTNDCYLGGVKQEPLTEDDLHTTATEDELSTHQAAYHAHQARLMKQEIDNCANYGYYAEQPHQHMPVYQHHQQQHPIYYPYPMDGDTGCTSSTSSSPMTSSTSEWSSYPPPQFQAPFPAYPPSCYATATAASPSGYPGAYPYPSWHSELPPAPVYAEASFSTPSPSFSLSSSASFSLSSSARSDSLFASFLGGDM